FVWFSFDTAAGVPQGCPVYGENMTIRIGRYLHRNRHETFYFRRAVPADLKHLFATKELYRTLATRDRREAIYRAIQLVTRTEATFRLLRTMPKDRKKTDLLQVDMVFTLDFDESGLLKNAIADLQPHEEEAAARVLPQLLRAAREVSAGVKPTDKAAAQAGEKISVLVDRYCAQQSQWAHESHKDIRGDLMQFVAISGDPLSTELTRMRLSEIQDLMFRLPSNMNKLAGLKGKSIADIIAMRLPAQRQEEVDTPDYIPRVGRRSRIHGGELREGNEAGGEVAAVRQIHTERSREP